MHVLTSITRDGDHLIGSCECGQRHVSRDIGGIAKYHELHVQRVSPTLCLGELSPFQLYEYRWCSGEQLNPKPHRKI